MEQRKTEPVYLGPENNKSGRFISLSLFLHMAIVASVTLMGIPQYETPLKEVVEFEVTSDVTGLNSIPDGTPVEPSQGPAPVSALAPELPKALPQKSVSLPPPPAPVIKESPVVVKQAPQVKAAPAIKTTPTAAAAVPETIDDIQAPRLETSDFGDVAVPEFDENELNDDFEKVNRKHQKSLEALKEDLEKDAEKVAAANAAALAQTEKENAAEIKALAAANDARRAREAKAIADAEAAERAAAEKTAADGRGQGGEGEGTGSSGSPAPTIEVAGIPGGVRALEQLRQKPGNKLPQYDRQERLLGQQGKSVFYAYVNKDGTLSQFKLGQSTGFRNLDAKTLSALKKWRFYPGQEGWVEMPYEWVLTGDAMEAGGRLRNSTN